jgi:tRNA-intron lyase
MEEVSVIVKEGCFKYGQVYVMKDDISHPLLNEEAFYLLSKGLLHLPINIEMIYQEFYIQNNKFPIKYKVYEYFKEKGFIVKGGINYGLDFTVYRKSPQFCHAEICAYVIDGTHPYDSKNENNGENGIINWQQLTTLTRVMPDVMKTLLLCYVLPVSYDTLSNQSIVNFSNPSLGVTEIDFISMNCLDLLYVRPLTALVRRQMASAELSMRRMYSKHKTSSILVNPRQEKAPKRKEKSRRDVNAPRDKVGSANNQKNWKTLASNRDKTNITADDAEISAKQESSQSSSLFSVVTNAIGWLARSVLGGNKTPVTIEPMSTNVLGIKRTREDDL